MFTRKSVLESGILRGMVDIHSHLLPGVDDGAQNIGLSREICDVYKEVGISKVFCTPHIMATMPTNNTQSLTDHFNLFSKEDMGIEFRLAAEYMLDEGFVETTASDGGMLSYDGKHVLAEVFRRGLFADVSDMLFGIIDNGYMPVLAHPERYINYSPADIEAIKERGILFQLNLPSLTDYYGEVIGRRARAFFEEGLYDFVATDFHGTAQLKFISALHLDSIGMKALERLLENNHTLWDGKLINR